MSSKEMKITTVNTDAIDIGEYVCETSQQLEKIYKGNIIVNKPIKITLKGILGGCINANSDSIIVITGIVNGDIHIKNANLSATGIVNGRIYNTGGNVSISGIINGGVKSDVPVKIASSAIINTINTLIK